VEWPAQSSSKNREFASYNKSILHMRFQYKAHFPKIAAKDREFLRLQEKMKKSKEAPEYLDYSFEEGLNIPDYK